MAFIESPTPDPTRFLPPDPTANCLKTGTLADLPRVPEDAYSVNIRTLQWYDWIRPQDPFHCWFVDRIACVSLRIEHLDRIERRLHDRDVFRARLFWDDDRRLEAITLGETLPQAPAKVVNQLRRTPQGCDWLIDRWTRLGQIAASGWDEPQQTLAFNLLGTHPDERHTELLAKPAELAAREIAALKGRKEEVAGLDSLDRAMAEADYVDVPNEEIRQLRRRDAELHRRMKWYLDRIEKKSPYQHAHPRTYPHFMRDLGPAAEAAPVAEAAPAVLEVAPEPQPAPPPQPEAPNLVIVGEGEEQPEESPATEAPVFPKPISERTQESLNKAQARREAKLRRLERRRA